MFDSDSSLPEIPDAPSTPVEERKFSAEQIFKSNLVKISNILVLYMYVCVLEIYCTSVLCDCIMCVVCILCVLICI